MEQKPFKLHSEYKPTGDQPQAIAELVEGFQKRFVKTLEESANGPEWEPTAPVRPPLADKNAILKLWAKS